MNLKFTKMHSLGNDFIVIDGTRQQVLLTNNQIKKLANRNYGIGFDQCLIIEPSSKANFFLRIYNADGTEVGQCGNGARCAALFVQENKLILHSQFSFETQQTVMGIDLHNTEVKISFPPPRFGKIFKDERFSLDFYTVDVGNPHAITQVKRVEEVDVLVLGKFISEHPYFPNQTNVEFIQPLSKDVFCMRVYERGCGETQACGSGAVASAAVAMKYLDVARKIEIKLLGGSLIVEWPDELQPIALIGSGEFVYEGEVFSSFLNIGDLSQGLK